MPTQHKASRTSAKSIQIRTQNCFDSDLTYMDHSLPPLGLFQAKKGERLQTLFQEGVLQVW
jgi:hypothetical protein